MVRGFVRTTVLTTLIAAAALSVGPAGMTRAATDAASLEEARKLMALTNAGQMADQMATFQLQGLTKLIADGNPGAEAAVRQIMEEVFLPEFRNTMPVLIDEMATLYTLHFSADELHALNAFYATPLGAKTVQTMPILMQQGMQIGQIWGQKVMEDAMKKAEPKFRERGIKL